MSEHPDTELRRRQIEDLRAGAIRLAGETENPSIKDLIGPALRDLDKGLIWLRHHNVHNGAAVLGIVDLIIQVSVLRLNEVEAWLTNYGPNVIGL